MGRPWIKVAALTGSILAAALWTRLTPWAAAAPPSPGPLQAGFEVSADLEPTPLLPRTEIFYDATDSLDLEAARALAAQGRFRPAPASLALGHVEGALWAHFKLVNPGERPAPIVLDVGFPQLDDVVLHTSIDAGAWATLSQGDTRPYAQRLFPVRTFVFPLEMPPHSSAEGFFRVRSTSVLSLPLEISGARAYWGALQDRSLLMGGFYGILLGLLAYNLFLFVSTRERAYFYYSAGSLFYALYFAQLDGLTPRLWDGVAPWQHYAVFVFVFLASASFIEFTRDYLELRSHAPRLGRALRSVSVIAVALAATAPLLPVATLEVLGVVLLSTLVLSPAAAVLRLRQGFRPALPYLVAWSPFLSVMILVALAAQGAIAGFTSSVVALQVAVASERILMSFALASRLKMMREHEHVLERQALDARAETLAEREQHAVTEQALHDREEQLRHAQKMDAIGQLAGGVAHDFNNLLTVIQGYAESLQDEVRSDPDLSEMTGEILDVSERAAGLTRQLLAFARRQPVEPRVVALNDTVVGLEKMLKRLLGETVSLELRLSPGLPSVEIDPGHLEQVVMNLAVNARDAMPKGGRLRLETAPVEVADEAGKPASFVGLRIVDEGVGMAPETQERIFEPFFTTKAAGRGTGLGLSTVYGIVTQAAGHFRVQSQLGHGTTIEVLLPALEEAAPTPPGAREAPTQQAPTGS